MLPDGFYVVQFRTPKGSGAGVLTLANGQLRGGDSAIMYTGTYSQAGDQFSANVSTRRHTQGMPSAFGVDAISIALSGKSLDGAASCTGRAAGVTFQADLHRVSG
jgi:T3SS negative regulator,GrlR